MKRIYIEPRILVVVLSDDILDEVITMGSDTDDFSKENTLNFDDDNSIEDGPRPKNLWDD